MRKAWRLLNVISNLLMKDCFPNVYFVSELFDKVQLIINKLRYRQHELENEYFQLDKKNIMIYFCLSIKLVKL